MEMRYALITTYDVANPSDPEYFATKQECFNKLEKDGYELEDEHGDSCITESQAKNIDVVDNGLNMAFIIRLEN